MEEEPEFTDKENQGFIDSHNPRLRELKTIGAILARKIIMRGVPMLAIVQEEKVRASRQVAQMQAAAECIEKTFEPDDAKKILLGMVLEAPSESVLQWAAGICHDRCVLKHDPKNLQSQAVLGMGIVMQTFLMGCSPDEILAQACAEEEKLEPVEMDPFWFGVEDAARCHPHPNSPLYGLGIKVPQIAKPSATAPAQMGKALGGVRILPQELPKGFLKELGRAKIRWAEFNSKPQPPWVE